MERFFLQVLLQKPREMSVLSKIMKMRDTWLVQLVECVALNLRVVNSKHNLGVEII